MCTRVHLLCVCVCVCVCVCACVCVCVRVRVRVRVAGYHEIGNDLFAPRHWELQGSTDGMKWSSLMVRGCTPLAPTLHSLAHHSIAMDRRSCRAPDLRSPCCFRVCTSDWLHLRMCVVACAIPGHVRFTQTHGKIARPDTTLTADCRVWTWDIPYNNQKPFGHFRILQTGPTSNARHLLSCSGFELYGRLLKPHLDPTEADEMGAAGAGAAVSAIAEAAEAREERIEALEDR
jgi:hypothetical protein